MHNKHTKLPQHDTKQIKVSYSEFIVKGGECGQGYVMENFLSPHFTNLKVKKHALLFPHLYKFWPAPTPDTNAVTETDETTCNRS